MPDPSVPIQRSGRRAGLPGKAGVLLAPVAAPAFRRRDDGRASLHHVYPRLVPECLLIEPTETETKETLDAFVDALVAIQREAEQDAAKVKGAPYTLPVRRLDDVRAAKQLDLAYVPGEH